MSDQLVRCGSADKCPYKGRCKHSKPHKFKQDHGYICEDSCAKGIEGSVCVPFSPEPQATDPDVVMAREYAKNTMLKYTGLQELLLRLADKVEGRSK